MRQMSHEIKHKAAKLTKTKPSVHELDWGNNGAREDIFKPGQALQNVSHYVK